MKAKSTVAGLPKDMEENKSSMYIYLAVSRASSLAVGNSALG